MRDSRGGANQLRERLCPRREAVLALHLEFLSADQGLCLSLWTVVLRSTGERRGVTQWKDTAGRTFGMANFQNFRLRVLHCFGLAIPCGWSANVAEMRKKEKCPVVALPASPSHRKTPPTGQRDCTIPYSGLQEEFWDERKSPQPSRRPMFYSLSGKSGTAGWHARRLRAWLAEQSGPRPKTPGVPPRIAHHLPEML